MSGTTLDVIHARNGWASVAEWAEIALAGFPSNRTAALKHAAREEWQSGGDSRARKRFGRGGGWEYHISCLPEAAQAEYARRVQAQQAETEVAERADSDNAQIAKVQTSLTARQRQVMEARAAVLRHLDVEAIRHGGFDAAVKSMLNAAEEGTLEPDFAALLRQSSDRVRSEYPSRRSIYNWKKAGASGVTALAPKRGAQQRAQSAPLWMMPFIRHYAQPSKPTIQRALEKYAQSPDCLGEVPSYDQVRRALKALAGTSDHLLRHQGREGRLALKARSAYVSRSVEGLDPGVVYTADGKTFDAEVQHPRHGRPFRPEITAILDVATRKCVGWSVGLSESADVVAQAILHAVQSNGIPAIFYVDRGAGYKNARVSTSTHGLCARLGTTPSHSLPYNSQARGVIERSHATIWNSLSKTYPSYMGADMDREAAQKVFKESRKALQIISGKRKVEDPETKLKAERQYSRLIVSWTQFLEDVEAAVAAYNDAPHSALRFRDPETGRRRKASPNEIWAQFEATGFRPFELEPGEADDLARPYEKRKTTRALVELHTNQYFSLDLEP